MAESGGILRDGSSDGSRSIGNIKWSSISSVGAGGSSIEGSVVPAGDGGTFARVEPEVAGSSIRNNSEGLGRCTNLNFSKVLSVHVILKWELFSYSIEGIRVAVLVDGSKLVKSSFS